MSEYNIVINGSEYRVEVLSVTDGKASVRVNGTEYDAVVTGSSESLMVSSSEPTRLRHCEEDFKPDVAIPSNLAAGDMSLRGARNERRGNPLESDRSPRRGCTPPRDDMRSKADPHVALRAPRNDVKSRAVQAPLPGVVLAVAVKEGQSVQRGQKLAVIEAMKMENDILAPVDGVVSGVSIAVGDSVLEGDILITIN